jgi:hypothetical protein
MSSSWATMLKKSTATTTADGTVATSTAAEPKPVPPPSPPVAPKNPNIIGNKQQSNNSSVKNSPSPPSAAAATRKSNSQVRSASTATSNDETDSGADAAGSGEALSKSKKKRNRKKKKKAASLEADEEKKTVEQKIKILFTRSQLLGIGRQIKASTAVPHIPHDPKQPARPPPTQTTIRTIQSIIETCPDIIEEHSYELLKREKLRKEIEFSFECSTCSMFDLSSVEITQKGIVQPPPQGACEQMQELIKASLKDCRNPTTRGLTFLCQKPEVIFSQLRVAVAFDPKRAPRKMREMPKKCIDRVKQFLCGDGFHFPPPAQNDHASWQRFSSALKFDLIMNNQTPIFAGLGKFWKRNHTDFEKFCHFLFWRDEPANPNNRGMIQHFQIPVIVACVSGDIDAAVMLMHMNFFVLSDEYLWGFPFMRLNVDPLKASVLRHLTRYFFRKQTERVLAAQVHQTKK